MEEAKKQPRKGFLVSPWPFVVASICFAIATYYLLDLYGIVHWQVMGPSTQIEVELKSLASQGVASQANSSTEVNRKEILEQMIRASERLSAASSSLLKRTAIYHITGLVSLILTIIPFWGRPRWAGFISLPFGLYGASLAFIIT